MKKTMLAIFVACSVSLYAQETMNGLGDQLDQIKAQVPNASVIGIVFNPQDTDISGQKVSIKTLALPATSAPMLVKNMRLIIKKVDAIYLLKGKNVTSQRLASFVLKNASKRDVKVFTNDPALAQLPGMGFVQVDDDGSYAVQYAVK